MSKELTPLEALKRMEEILIDIADFNRIKHTECPDTEKWVRVSFKINDIEKKLKALEIIKKHLDCSIFIKELTKYYDKETIDLLKEVLL